MAANNSSDQNYVNNSDGYALAGGTTSRSLTVTGANITLTGSGSNVFTFPGSTDTLAGISVSQTITNKTFDATNLISGNSGVPSTPGSGLAKLFGIGTSNLRPGWINQGGTPQGIVTQYSGGYIMQSGSVSVSIAGTNFGTATVTFSTAFPNAVTAVIPSYNDTATNAINGASWAYSISTTGFTVRLQDVDGSSRTGTYPVGWIAIGT